MSRVPQKPPGKFDPEPQGTIYVSDFSSLNWLFVLFNTMEELVRADHDGRLIPSLAENARWLDDCNLEVKLRHGIIFQNQQPFNAEAVQKSFEELQKWFAPHPPGTWLNPPAETTCEMIDHETVRFHFPYPDGLALGKMRAIHIANFIFWQKIGFGYAKNGSGEGHW